MMKVINKIFVIALLLSLIFSVSAVAAQENITFDQSDVYGVSTETDSSSNLNQELDVSKNDKSISSEIENTDSSPLKAEKINYTVIQGLIDSANDGDTIYLDGKTYEGSTELKINKSITIVGGSKSNPDSLATLDSLNLTRAMNISASNVFISGITFINGASDEGGTIYLEGDDCFIYKCTFINNTALNGGAIYVCGVNNHIELCDFTRNTAEYDGGAIYSEGVDFKLINSVFDYNSAEYGGAVYVIGNETLLHDVYAIYNHALVDGGTIYLKGNRNRLEHVLIDNSRSERNGGAIYLEGNNNTVFNITVEYSSSYIEGAALYVTGNDFDLSESIFDSNHGYIGGAVIWYGENGFIRSCEFFNNTGYFGGAVMLMGQNTTVEGVHFLNNSAEDKGGAIGSYSGDNKVINSYFENNSATYGGACFFEWGHTDIIECTFKANNAQEGGALGGSGSNAQVSYSTFERNTAKNGGAIFWGAYGTNLHNCSFTDNQATSCGGAITWYGDGNISDSNFTNNSAKYAGAVHILRDGAIIDHNNFISNSAKYSGTTFWVDGADDSIINNYIRDNSDLPAFYITNDKNLTLKNNDMGDGELCYPSSFMIEVDENFLLTTKEKSKIKMYVYDNFNNPMEGHVIISGPSYNYVYLDEGIGYFESVISNSETLSKFTASYRSASRTFNVTVVEVTQPFAGSDLIRVKLPSKITGNLTLTINGKKYHSDISENYAFFNVNDLPNGAYVGELAYSGNEIYAAASNDNVSIVLKNSNVELYIDAPDIIVGHIGQYIQVPVHIYTSLNESAVGEVTATIYGPNYHNTLTLIDGKMIFDIPMPRYQTTSNIYLQYMHYKKTIKLEIADPQNPIKNIYQEENLIIVELPSDATGTVNLTVNSMQFNANVIGGKATVKITNLLNGTYDGIVKYSGDGTYATQEKTTKVKVTGSNVTANIIVVDEIVGHIGKSLQIPVHVISSEGDNLTGKVSAYCADEGFESITTLIEGGAIFDVPMPHVPTTMELVVEYSGFSKTVLIKVVDPQKPIQNITQGEGDSIIINLPDDATGNVTVTINDKEYNSTVENGTAVINITDLPNGTYEAKVNYSGDGNYSSSEETIPITIKNSNVTAEIVVGDEFIGHAGSFLQVPVYVYSSLGDKLNGDISAYCKDVSFKSTTSLIDGEAGFYIPMPHAPTVLNLVIEYMDYSKNVIIKVVDPKKPIGNITQPEGNDAIVINFPEDATGNVTVVIGDKNYTSEVINGSAVVNITDLPNGTYDAEIIYSGDENYDPVVENTTVVIKNSNVSIIIDAENTIGNVGETVLVSISVYTSLDEKLTGEINAYCRAIGFEVTESLINGNVVLDIPLPNQPTTLELTIAYGEAQKAIQIIVMDVSSKDGGNGTVIIDVGGNSTGEINIEIDGKNYTGEVNNGTAVVNITDLPNGTYDAVITYTDENGTTTVENTTIVIENSNVSIIIDTVDEVIGHMGKTLQIPVLVKTSLGDLMKGEVKVFAAGFAYEGIENLSDGIAVFKIPMPDYPTVFSLMFFYNGMHKTVKVTVVDTQKPIGNVTQPDNGTDAVVIDFPEDATGNVTVVIGDKNYTAEVINGSAVVNITDLPNGTYNATVIYSGDGNYSSMTQGISVIVKNSNVKPKNPVYGLSGKDITVIYSGGATYVVLVTKDGKPVGAGESVTITFNGISTDVKTDANGYARLLINTNIKPKTYDITVSVGGVSTTNKVKIAQIIKAGNKKVKKSRKVTKIKISLKKVDGKFLAKKVLKIKFNKKTYKVKTNKKGVAKWKVKKSMLKKLKPRKKVKYTVTYGQAKLTKKLTIKK